MLCDTCKYSDISNVELGHHNVYYDEYVCTKRKKRINNTFFDNKKVVKCADYEEIVK